MQGLACALNHSGGPYDKIGDPTFDIDRWRDNAGSRASLFRHEAPQTYQKSRFPDCPSGVAGRQPARSVRRRLPRHRQKLRVQDMAASDRSGPRSENFRLRRRL